MSEKKEKEDNKQYVYVEELAWAKMMAYADEASPDEIIGMAHCRVVKGNIIIHDPFILKQKISAAECEFDNEEFAKFIGEHDRIDEVLCVWHSHVNMSAFFSSCDRNTSNALAQLGKMLRSSSSWFVSVVLNLKGEYECKVDVYQPLKTTVNANLQIVASNLPEMPEEEIKKSLEEAEKKIKKFEEDQAKALAAYTEKQYHDAKLTLIVDGIKKDAKKEVKEKCSSSRASSPAVASYYSGRGWYSGGGMMGLDEDEFKGYSYDDLFAYLDIK